MRFLIAMIVFGCGVCASFAQKTKTVENEYTYYAPENVTLEQAKQIAVERAKIQAIAEEFGTTVSQTNIANIKNAETSSVDFQSIGITEVKGEWIEDVHAPVFDINFSEGVFVVTATVKGKIRELISSGIDCEARILRNGKTDRDETATFTSGDQIYLSFISPVNGFLTVYLSDGNGIVSCLLPYPTQPTGNYPIKANKRHLLFDGADGNDYTEEYYLTCSEDIENNIVYVIFSPNDFTKAIDRESKRQSEDLLLPRELPESEFQKWLAKCRRRDTKMQLIRKPITIANQ